MPPTIYLYVKRHRTTGLLYFGKTIRDPYKYNGSGLYWESHLRKHGTDIETLKVWTFTDQKACTKFALEFSKLNNIVESTQWANLIDENALSGIVEGYVTKASTRKKLSESLKGRKANDNQLQAIKRHVENLKAGILPENFGKKISEGRMLTYEITFLDGRKERIKNLPVYSQQTGIPVSSLRNMVYKHESNQKWGILKITDVRKQIA